MTQNLPSLLEFSRLNRTSSKKDVHNAVVDVIREIYTSLTSNPDLGLARGSISQILKFLHELNTTVHPGRIALSKAIGNELLKSLYQPPFKKTEKAAGKYKYAAEEKILLAHITNTFQSNLRFLRGDDPLHRGYGIEKLDLGIPSLCIFAPEFSGDVLDVIIPLLQYRLRTKSAEQDIYEPMIKKYLSLGKDPAGFFKMHPTLVPGAVKECLVWAQKKFCLIPQDQEIQFAKNYRNEKDYYSFDEMLCIEVLDKLLIQSLDNNYFLPTCIDFMFLNSLFSLDKEKINKGYEIIAHAIKMGEEKSYIIRRIDSLDRTHSQHLFDFALLSAYYFGDDFGRLPYRFIHDACIGGANQRETIEINRPMLSAEVCRRPTHLAAKIVKLIESGSSDADDIKSTVIKYMETVSQLNAIRFERELIASLGLFVTNSILSDLVVWLESPIRTKMVANDDTKNYRFKADETMFDMADAIVVAWKQQFGT